MSRWLRYGLRYFCVACIVFSIKAQTTRQPLTNKDVFVRHPAGFVNAQTKTNLPIACGVGTKQSLMSFIKTASPEIHHPTGDQLFNDDPELGKLLTTFLTNLSQDYTTKNFTAYFTRLHLIILHELYLYLTKIYSVFNMTHIDQLLAQTVTEDGKQVYHEGYLEEGVQQALNQKTLIVNHLINIVEAQSNGAIRARFPTLQPIIATYAGNMLMKHDYGVDVNIMIDKSELFLVNDPAVQELIKPEVAALRDSYLGLFADYLKFFNRYTSALHQDETSRGYVGSNRFAMHAKRIAQIMQDFAPIADPAHKTTIKGNNAVVSRERLKWLRSLKKLDPPIFFYDEQTMRGLKIIPALAKSMGKNVKSVPWPAKIVDDADNRRPFQSKYAPPSDKLVAFYKTSKGGSKKRLFVNIPTMDYWYEQELLPQPEWLNSVDGIIKMLQACLGDFSALLDPIFQTDTILDPFIQCIIHNASVKAGLPVPASDKSCAVVQKFVESLKKEIEKQKGDGGLIIPDGGGTAA